MRFCLLRSLLVLCIVSAFGIISAAGPARAEFTLIDRIGVWFFYTQRGVGQKNAACQVVSCVRGVCGAGATSRTQFSLYDARDGRGIQPEFIAPRRAKPGEAATLVINDRRYTLRNLFKSPQFYILPESREAGTKIIEELRVLEKTDRLGKFNVIDPQGRQHIFTVQGVSESLERMERRCTPRG